jgi:adenosylcobyric acid synthase
MSKETKSIMFLGTGSDVGKSITATAFCRILKRRGISVAPFKAQNMSNNSFITAEGGEIGRAQVVQAEASGLIPSSDMNPILLKPSSGLGAQVVIQGKVAGQMAAMSYHEYKPNLVKAVMESYHRLAAEFDVIVMEGAGSCGEINLKKNDLVNFGMARRVNAPCVLVGDIDRGGVFAQIIGSMALMTRKEKDLTKGFIINKFRGDPNLFKDGIDIIEKRTRRPVYGLVPFYENIYIDPEDSVAVQTDKRPVLPTQPSKVNVAVIKLPGISNFTDVESLERESDVLVNYLTRAQNLEDYDLLLLPGTKNVVEDAVWLSRTGWAKRIRNFVDSGGWVLGLCGGYQLLGQELHDPLGVESPRKKVKALSIIPLVTRLEGDKILRKVDGKELITNKRIQGYEIHMGRTRPISENAASELNPTVKIRAQGQGPYYLDGYSLDNGRIRGTYVHGLLDAPGFRLEYLNAIRRNKGLPERKKAAPGHGQRFKQYDLLADHYEKYVDVDAVLKEIGI